MKFELDFPPCKKEFELFSVRYVFRVWEIIVLHKYHNSELIHKFQKSILVDHKVDHTVTSWFLLAMLTKQQAVETQRTKH